MPTFEVFETATRRYTIDAATHADACELVIYGDHDNEPAVLSVDVEAQLKPTDTDTHKEE